MKQNKETKPVQPSIDTVGEWTKQDKIIYIKEGSVNIYAYPIVEKDYPVAYVLINSKITTKQAEANAARIAECWNGYDKAKNAADENYQKFQDLGDLYAILKAENESLKEQNRKLSEALRRLIAGEISFNEADSFLKLIKTH